MAFLSGIWVIHAPASALNNAGMDAGQMAENKATIKKLRIGRQYYPYVSAQAWRYWLRTTLEKQEGWCASPIFREAKIAYTDANPIQYDDDDIFGYMRAPSKKQNARTGESEATPIEGKDIDALTRVAPLRMGTLVGLFPQITTDFGTMSRHEGDPVPHEHEFYTGPLRGLFGLDMGRVGVFTTIPRTGFLNLDEIRRKEAEKAGATSPDGGKTYILPREERWRRIEKVLSTLPLIEGGAKQTLHATDVTPVIVVMAVFRGGVNPFYPILQPHHEFPVPTLALDALKQLYEAWKDQLLSPLYIGWVAGYPPEKSDLSTSLRKELAEQLTEGKDFFWGHPREAFERLIEDLRSHTDWWEPILPSGTDRGSVESAF